MRDLLRNSLIIAVLTYSQAFAQDNFIYISVDTPGKAEAERFQITEKEADLFISNKLTSLWDSGYFTAYLDTIYFEDHYELSIKSGSQYNRVLLQSGNLPTEIYTHLNFKEEDFKTRSFSIREMNYRIRSIVTYSGTIGYPFATVKLDSVVANENGLCARLHYEKGPYITFDTLTIEGNARVRRQYLSIYLGIVPNEPFNEKRLETLEQKINQTGFLKLNGQQIKFANQKAGIILQLEDKRVNSIDAFAGFLPNEGDQNGLLVTGKVNLNLKNLFYSGKSLKINWDRITKETQQFSFDYHHPQLFQSNLDLNSAFDLLKQDTAFINIKAILGFQYRSDRNSLGIYSGFENGRLNSKSVSDNQAVLPAAIDKTFNFYGLNFRRNTLDDAWFPFKGYEFSIDVSAGNKRIMRNAKLDAGLYSTLDPKTIQYQVKSTLTNYFKIKTASVLKWRIEAAKVFNPRLFLNDLYRIGGIYSLRGFNENHFFASAYAMTSLELRVLMGGQSFLYLFYDQGYLENKAIASGSDFPFGSGFGFDLSVKEGRLNLAFALGSSNDNELSLNLAKVHLGYKLLF